jgi:hypothetical protein
MPMGNIDDTTTLVGNGEDNNNDTVMVGHGENHNNALLRHLHLTTMERDI